MSHSTFGTLGRKLAAWVVLALVAVLSLKLAVGIFAGPVMGVVTALAAVAILVAAVWAVRRL